MATMITFSLTVVPSFLNYPNHPITIRRAYYERLTEEIYDGHGEKTIKVRITPPSGRILDGEIYYGKAGYGPFYQIKALGRYPNDYFGNRKINDILKVTIKKIGDNV